MKRFTALFLGAILLIFALVGCAGTGENSGEKTTEGKSEAKEESIKIEDIAWKVEEAIVDKERKVCLEYTNNSKYTLVGFEMNFKQKDGITEEEKNAFFDDIKKEFGADEEDSADLEKLKTKDITMRAESDDVCQTGKTVSQIPCKYYEGYVEVINIKHYELVTPDIATIKYIDNGIIYTTYYDFAAAKFTKDSEVEQAFEWGKNGLEQLVPKPDAEYVSVGSDRADGFSFDIHGADIEKFNSYVTACKEKGFTVKEIASFLEKDKPEQKKLLREKLSALYEKRKELERIIAEAEQIIGGYS